MKKITFTDRVQEIHSYLNEATRSKYEIFHDSFTSAVGEALDYAKKNGYEVNENDWFNHITVGRGRPKDGQTFSTHIGLDKNGKAVRKVLHIQVYNRETHYRTYELNCYIS